MSVPVKLRPAPLWRPRFTPEFFAEMESNPRGEVQIAYNRGYRLNAISESDKKFPHFESCRQRGIVLGDIVRNSWPKFTGVDLSGKKRKGNAIVTIAVDPYSKHRYVIDVRAGAWRSSETAEQIGQVHAAFNPRVIMVEDNGYQESLIDLIKIARYGFWPIVEPTTTTGYNKSSTEIGLPALDVEFKNQAWVIPWSEYDGALPEDPGARGMWARFDVEFRNYPFAATSDMVMACIGSGSLVTTARGMVSIESVVVGDLVLTHRGNWKRVSGIESRNYEGVAYQFRAAGSFPFVVTPEHPIWSAGSRFLRDGTNRLVPVEWDWRTPDGLSVGRKTEGDYAFLPSPPVGQPPPIDLLNYSGPGSMTEVLGNSLTTKDMKRIDRFRELDRDFAFLIGLYVAEGSIGRRRTAVSFALSVKEEYIAAFVVEQMKRIFNAKSSIRITGGSLTVVSNTTLGAQFFSQFGASTKKAIPFWLLEYPTEISEWIVRGWLVGDGNSMSTGGIRGVSISKHILHGAALILRRLGLCSSLVPHEKGGRRLIAGHEAAIKPSWRLSLSESDTARLLADPNETERIRWGLVGRRSREKTNSMGVSIENGIATRIRAIEATFYKGLVHNLHVEDDESFCVEGVAVHNCWFARQGVDRFLHFFADTDPGGSVGNINAR